LSEYGAAFREDVVGLWAIEKHTRLHDYLIEYTKIMKSQTWCRGFEYIDAFAGSGSALLRDQDVRIDGSPRIALGLPHPFTTYTFIETDPRRVAQLQVLKAEFPDKDIRIVQEDCNRVICRDIAPRITYRAQRRAFAFIDPFSTDVDYDTISQISETGAIEMFLHFPSMAINRAVLHNRIGPHSDGVSVPQMDRLWGNHDWYGHLYHQQPDLFGEDWAFKKRRTDAAYLSNLFVEKRLRRLFPYVNDPIVIKNTRGADNYCLIYAGHKETAARIADYVFRKKIDPVIPLSPTATLPLELSF
jgi:three-Cys-motif partner protein